MKTMSDLHRTGEQVEETGRYVCEIGETKQLSRGDSFPACPRTGKATNWRHADHEHKTGQSVTEAGRYVDASGQQVELKVGDAFPSCPSSGKETGWKHL
ncbi:hypothetical protein [Paenibacillus glycinis]|uniref:YjzC family protein n=1 Tax=Paenibacillus glycinis TaxID=2697035 RepID=A0ABW9XKS4_9BACL|nr:hypothetical protein [Paenibacillus glycinis]NBD23212.1 hypothetical protein [Paenibacillus glycinis]